MLDSIISTGLIGVSLGAEYALLALGFTLIFGILGVVNFAHGGFYTLGGYAAYCSIHYLGTPFLIALVLATLATFLIGVVFELLILRPVIYNELATLIITLGFYLLLVSGLLLTFGPEAPPFNFPFMGRLHLFRGVYIPYSNLAVLILCVGMIGAVYLLIHKTKLGLGLRAISDDREIASALGWPSTLLFALTFGIATGLAGFTGALVTPMLSLTPSAGDSVLVISFLIVILGGLGSIGGATVAAFIVGVVDTFSAVYMGGSRGTIVLFILVIAILVLRPSGLAGKVIRGA